MNLNLKQIKSSFHYSIHPYMIFFHFVFTIVRLLYCVLKNKAIFKFFFFFSNKMSPFKVYLQTRSFDCQFFTSNKPRELLWYITRSVLCCKLQVCTVHASTCFLKTYYTVVYVYNTYYLSVVIHYLTLSQARTVSWRVVKAYSVSINCTQLSPRRDMKKP